MSFQHYWSQRNLLMEIYPFINARLYIELSQEIIGYFTYEFKSSFLRITGRRPSRLGQTEVQHDLSFWLSPVMFAHCLIHKGLLAHNANFDSFLRPCMLKVRIFDIFTVRLGTVIPAASGCTFQSLKYPEVHFVQSGYSCTQWILQALIVRIQTH